MLRSPCSTNAPEPIGTSRIRGSVIAVETGSPLRNAQIRLSGGLLCRPRNTATDDKGEYEFESLPPGRYTVNATKPGYVSLAYGQRRPWEAGRPVDLAAAQALENVNLALPRGGVIVARVTDENGEPLSNVRMQVERMAFSQGRRQLIAATNSATYLGVQTDDRGEIRLFGLPPGEYYVRATGQGSNPMPSTAAAANRGRSYLPTYFPGTVSAAAAQRIAVQGGRETAVTFPLVIGRQLRIAGIVRGSDGAPAQANGFYGQSVPGMSYSMSLTVQPDGRFTSQNLLPGRYVLQMTTRPAAGAVAEVASVVLDLDTEDVTDLALTLHRGGSLRGRFVYDTPPPASFRSGSLGVMVEPVMNGEIASTFRASPGTQFRPDSTFELTGLTSPGFVRLNPGSGWFVKAVTVGGRDMTDVPIDFSDGREVNDVEVVVTQKSSQIAGTVSDDKGPVHEYAAVLFPEDRERWTSPSRFIAAARADQQGKFKIVDLPAGRYLIAAVDYLELGSEFDPELLARLKDSATAIALGEGETKDIALRVVTN